MSDTVATFLLTSLFWWALLTSAYGLILFSLDAVLSGRAHRQWARRQFRAELVQISREADASMQRIDAAFELARRLIREEAAISRRGGR